MNYWQRFINDIYSGIFYYSSKYESSEVALKNSNFRMMSAFFLYYFSLVLIILKVFTLIFGSYKGNIFQAIVMLISYVFTYNFLIRRNINSDAPHNNLSSNEIKRKIVFCKYFFMGGIVFFLLTIIIGNY